MSSPEALRGGTVSKKSALSFTTNGADIKTILGDVWKVCSLVALDVVGEVVLQQAMSGGNIGQLVVHGGKLSWDIGRSIYHVSSMRKQLAMCIAEYTVAGLLELHQDPRSPSSSYWTVTPAFHEDNFLFLVYKDIAQYVFEQKITKTELQSLGWRSKVTLHAQNSSVKEVTKQLSKLSELLDFEDITKTDLNRRLNYIRFPKLGASCFENACVVEAERRRQREVNGLPPDDHIVPVLGRVLVIVALCGIRDINLRDITTILAKAPLFETIARSRLASLRNHHASHIINTPLFRGSTESATKDFAKKAMEFKDKRVEVGYVEQGLPRFNHQWFEHKCAFSHTVSKETPYKTPLYMLAGWSNLIQQREHIDAGYHDHAYLKLNVLDVHGNYYKRNGPLDWVKFACEELPDGTLMAKPDIFTNLYKYHGDDWYKRDGTTKASGETKHFGGLVGPSNCGCTRDERKGHVIHAMKYCDDLKIENCCYPGNTIDHTDGRTKKHISIIWQTGDWAIGAFMMQMLPQSSYLQGRGECLHCAVENAALTGCSEVIACGGGKVTEEALASPPLNIPLDPIDKPGTSSAPRMRVLSNPVNTHEIPPTIYELEGTPVYSQLQSRFSDAEATPTNLQTPPPEILHFEIGSTNSTAQATNDNAPLRHHAAQSTLFHGQGSEELAATDFSNRQRSYSTTPYESSTPGPGYSPLRPTISAPQSVSMPDPGPFQGSYENVFNQHLYSNSELSIAIQDTGRPPMPTSLSAGQVPLAVRRKPVRNSLQIESRRRPSSIFEGAVREDDQSSTVDSGISSRRTSRQSSISEARSPPVVKRKPIPGRAPVSDEA